MLPLRRGRLRSVLVRDQAHLRVTVRECEKVLVAKIEPIPVLAYNHWLQLPEFFAFTAILVQPKSLALCLALRLQRCTWRVPQATMLLPNTKQATAARDAHAGSPAQHVAHDVVLGHIDPPPGFEVNCQKIRLVADTLAQGRGTCLDLACLQVTLWEQIGLHPLLIIAPGHAIMGC